MVTIVVSPTGAPRAGFRKGRKVRRRRPHHLDIPAEIMLEITSYLSKPDWKSLRLVSHSFNSFSTHYLPFFTELWFSPHAEDLEVFNHVCNTPSLAQHVTTILYDVTMFTPLSLSELHSRWPAPWRTEARTRRRRKTWRQTHPGFPRYLQHVEDQGKVDQESVLASGMRNLPKLKKLFITYPFHSWSSHTDCARQSPLSRTWRRDRPHCDTLFKDHRWYLNPLGTTPGLKTGKIESSHLNIIISALVAADIKLEEFNTWQDCLDFRDIDVFNVPPSLVEGTQAIFAGLTSLSLRLDFTVWHKIPGSAFGRLVRVARQVRKLHLYLATWGPWLGVDTLTDLFNNEIVFPHLTDFQIGGLHTLVRSICGFLWRHKGTLKWLKLVDMKLSRGDGKWNGERRTWADVTEWLRGEMDLERVRIHNVNDGDGEFHYGEPGWRDRAKGPDDKLGKEMKLYNYVVLKVGANPFATGEY